MPAENKLSFILPWIIPLSLFAAWIVTSSFRLVPPYLVPGPAEVSSCALSYIFDSRGDSPYAGRFTGDLSASLLRVCAGFGLAVALALPAGIISGRLVCASRLLETFINALRTVPGITWLPLSLAWFGIGIKTTVFLVSLAAFFPVYANISNAARSINPHILQAGAMMGVGRIRGTFHILIPGCMPQIMTGLRLGLGISWAYLVLGELTGVPDGLGAVIMDARMLGRTDMIVVGMIAIAIVGKLSDSILVLGIKTFFRSARRMK